RKCLKSKRSKHLTNCRFGEENSQASAFSVYPNPADNYITIEWNATEQGTTHIVLTDITGKMVKQDVVNNNTGINIVSMDVSMLPKGIYMLSAINNNGVMNKRVVIE
ncbi:MAG: glycosyl hydrolase, partial [Bacteroidetes bacterium OLB10]